MNSSNVKILLINNFYYHRGGDCTYLFSLKNLLEHKGHKVVIFSMHHPENYDSEYSNYFVSHINYNEELKNRNLLTPLKVLSRSIYSRESRIKIEQLIKTERPDIAHVQNIHHHITPSIFYTLRHYHIPIVWTLHDYTLICPNTSFVSHGSICEKCKKIKYYWPTLTQCKKNSLAASTMAGLESTMLRLMNAYRLVNVFIAPSNFMRNKLLEYGLGKYPIVTLHNFIDPPASPQHMNTITTAFTLEDSPKKRE